MTSKLIAAAVAAVAALSAPHQDAASGRIEVEARSVVVCVRDALGH